MSHVDLAARDRLSSDDDDGDAEFIFILSSLQWDPVIDSAVPVNCVSRCFFFFCEINVDSLQAAVKQEVVVSVAMASPPRTNTDKELRADRWINRNTGVSLRPFTSNV